MTIQFWFDFGSNYSYLSMLRIAPLAAAAGVQVQLKPFMLGPIFKSFGWDSSPFVLQPLKGRYVWNDMRRQCAKFGLRWQQPSQFPRNGLLAARIALQAEAAPWLPAFYERVMLANFADDLDISDEAVIGAILADLGVDSARTIAEAKSDSAKASLRARTEEAAALGIFGAPMFLVGEEMFWGNDRLEDALAYAQQVSAPAALG
ncbi:2-hydroxychromene-2-carboxylate isomerase [Massilia sp. TS11]|nr:2-hydroxychromene-2-carboxylate isomerase [Massilia sp. TS11]